MDIPANKNKSDWNRSGPFSAVIHIVLDIFDRLMGIFTLTESDRMKAGIHVRRRGV